MRKVIFVSGTLRLIVSVLILCIMLISAYSETVGAQDIRLIIKGADLGMTQGSLTAFEEGFNHGVLTCGAMQVVGPWFEAAAEQCRKNPGWCIGIHLTLVAEWRGYRWRPVLSWDKVPSLVDDDGFLHQDPDSLWAEHPSLEEIDAELRAQVDLALKKGVNVRFLDCHYMDLNTYPGLGNLLLKMAEDYDVPFITHSAPFLLGEKSIGSVYMTPVGEKTETAAALLEKLEPGLWWWGVHIGVDTPEQNALIHRKPEHIFPGGGVGTHRAGETAAVTSYDVKAMILKKEIKLTNYYDVWVENGKTYVVQPDL